MKVTDLSIAFERERLRLDEAAKNNQVSFDEVRVTYALLTVLADECRRIAGDAAKARGLFLEVLVQNGVNPIIAETWAKSSS